jgi:hypothetical protein
MVIGTFVIGGDVVVDTGAQVTGVLFTGGGGAAKYGVIVGLGGGPGVVVRAAVNVAYDCTDLIIAPVG